MKTMEVAEVFLHRASFMLTRSHDHPGLTPRLTPTTSFTGHTKGIFALAWDSTNQQLASSSKDGSLILWDSQGRQLERCAAQACLDA